MRNVLVRDVADSVVEKLKLQAKLRQRSLQAELKMIIYEASERCEPMSALELIRKIRAGNTKVNKTDSADLLREDRAR